MLRRLIALAFAALLIGQPAAALTPQLQAALGKQAFHGPGSRGFLPLCSGTFNVTNYIKQSNTFGTTWAGGAAVVAAPTIVTSTATAPDGSATATTISLPTVTGANAESVLYQQATLAPANYAWTFSVWAKDNSPATNGTAYITMDSSTGTQFARAPIPADGQWHQVSLLAPGYAFTAAANAFYVEIGVDTRDTGQAATTGSISLSIWNSQLTAGRGPGGNPWPYIATTTAVVSALKTVSCPPGIAYRDFGPMQAYTGNPNPIEDATDLYTAGGVSNPYVAQYSMIGGVGGGKFYAFANATDTNNHNHWCGLPLYAGNPYNWTQISAASAPPIIAPGSNCPAGTVGTGNIKQYMLHPFLLQNGCTVSSVFYPYCAYFSATSDATPAGNPTTFGVYMAYASAIEGPYTVYGGGTQMLPSVMIQTNFAANKPNTIGTIAVGGTQYLYTNRLGNSSNFSSTFTSTDGVNWTFFGTALNPIQSTDWDGSGSGNSTTYGEIDIAVTANKCGFYEYYFSEESTTGRNGATGGTGQKQQIGYAISDSPLGPWFKFNGPNGTTAKSADGITHGDIALPTSLWNGAPYLGDSAVLSLNGVFIWTGNYDNGSNQSRGVTAMMPDACAY